MEGILNPGEGGAQRGGLATRVRMLHGGAMPTLKDLLLAPAKRPAVVKDCVQLVDAEVAAKGGLAGMALKAPTPW